MRAVATLLLRQAEEASEAGAGALSQLVRRDSAGVGSSSIESQALRQSAMAAPVSPLQHSCLRRTTSGRWSQFSVLNRIRGDMRGERADAELLSSGVASDFGFFYDRHVKAVTAFVGSWIGEPDVVFDLVAETFARALEHRLQYDSSKGPTVAWLLGIARNLMIDSARRGQVESDSRERLGMGRVELDEEQLGLIADRADVRLRDALASLEPVQREAVIRRVVLEESYRTIAIDLRCSEQVVRKRVSRGLARLRGSLEGR